jgi:hypothetical protein
MLATPKGTTACSYRGIKVRLTACYKPYGTGGAVLLMVGMQDEQDVQSLHMQGVRLIGVDRSPEHHVQEVFTVGELVGRFLEVQPVHLAVAECCDGTHLGKQSADGKVNVLFRVHIGYFGVECRKGSYHGRKDGHGVGFLGEVTEKVTHIDMQQGVPVEHLCILVSFWQVGKLTFDEQVGHLDKVAMVYKIFNIIATIPEDTFLTIDKANGAHARACIHKARVVGDEPCLVAQLGDIKGFAPHIVRDHGPHGYL